MKTRQEGARERPDIHRWKCKIGRFHMKKDIGKKKSQKGNESNCMNDHFFEKRKKKQIDKIKEFYRLIHPRTKILLHIHRYHIYANVSI